MRTMHLRVATATIGIAGATALAGAPFQQAITSGAWGSWGPPPPLSYWDFISNSVKYGSSMGAFSFDADGPGPVAPCAVVYGRDFMATPNVDSTGLVAFDGQAWAPMPITGCVFDGDVLKPTDVESASVFDPDGSAGAQNPVVVFSGRSAASGARTVATWSPGGCADIVPSGFDVSGNESVETLAEWNPLGLSTSARRLVASGYFSTFGGQFRNWITDWSGASWGPFGGGFSGPNPPAYSRSWDPDGAGPLGEVVAMYGGTGATMIFAGQSLKTPIAWNGASATPIDMGVSASTTYPTSGSLWTIDPDGDGGESWLVASGSHVPPGQHVSVKRMLVVNDAGQHSYLGEGFLGTVRRLTWWDPDASGPGEGAFLVVGQMTQAGEPSSQWVMATISLAGDVDVLFSSTDGGALQDAVVITEPNPSGPGEVQVVYGVRSGISTALTPWTGIARWGGSAFERVGPEWGLEGGFESLVVHDADGEGPGSPTVYANGVLGWNGVSVSDGLFAAFMRQSGDAWEPFDLGPNAPLPHSSSRNSVSIDWDGVGGAPPDLVVYFDGSLRIVRENQQWETIPGSTVSGTIRGLTVWDRDDDGPIPPVIAMLSSSGANWMIRSFDGTAWTHVADVESLTSMSTIDFDGPGPGVRELLVYGTFTTVDGQPMAGIASFDGVRWAPRSPVAFASTPQIAVARWQLPTGQYQEQLVGIMDFQPGLAFARYEPISADTGSWSPVAGAFPTEFTTEAVAIDTNGPCPGGEGLVFALPTGDPGPGNSDGYFDILWWDGGASFTVLVEDVLDARVRAAIPTPASSPAGTRVIVSFGGTQIAGVRAPGAAFFDIPHVGCAGDITCDGATDAGDFTVFAANFGQGPSATHNLGDLNGDGLVNAADFVILASEFGCAP